MQDEKQQGFKDLQLKFVAKILASFTHEMKNHLAIIKESGGLIQDLIDMGKMPKKKDAEFYVSSLQLIDDQVKRSIDVIDVLNRFSHRMDRPVSSFSVNHAVRELIVLTQRIANQKKISLEEDFQRDIPPITNEPSRLQLLVHSFLEEMLQRLDAGGKIVFRTSCSPDSVSIRLVSEGKILDDQPGENMLPQELLQEILQRLSGAISRTADNKEVTIKLFAPQAPVQD